MTSDLMREPINTADESCGVYAIVRRTIDNFRSASRRGDTSGQSKVCLPRGPGTGTMLGRLGDALGRAGLENYTITWPDDPTLGPDPDKWDPYGPEVPLVIESKW